MLIFDMHSIGNKLLEYRKRLGLTQALVAERADISDRIYADIERGTVNMRVKTLLRICEVLHVTPDQILTTDAPTLTHKQEELMADLEACTPRQKTTALNLLATYLHSLSET